MSKELQELLKKDAVTVARALLGWELYNLINGQLVGGRIVETEAYTQDDPASHTYRGQTPRNTPMFMAGGTLYVYFTYGMHWCMNIVTGLSGHGEAVLLRAIEPLKGLEIMQRNRKGTSQDNLANGPAKLVQALGIDPAWSGKTLSQASLMLKPGQAPRQIVVSPRIGIREVTKQPWRFSIPKA